MNGIDRAFYGEEINYNANILSITKIHMKFFLEYTRSDHLQTLLTQKY